MIRFDSPQVVAVAELVHVALEVSPADAVELAEHPALQERPKALNRIRVENWPSTYHFACLMTACGTIRPIPE